MSTVSPGQTPDYQALVTFLLVFCDVTSDMAPAIPFSLEISAP